MSLVKKSLIALAVLAVLLGAALGVFVYTFDANRYRGVILEQLSRSVNRPVEAADLSLQLLPLRLRLNQVRIPEDPNFPGEVFIRARAVQFDFSLWALLQGETRVSALELVQPVVYLRQSPTGEWNVATLAASPSETEPAPATAPTAPAVRNWSLEDGTIVIERPGQPTLRLTGVEVVARDISTTEAFPLRVAVSFAPDSRLSLDGRLGPLDLAAPVRTPFQGEVVLENFRPAALASLVTVPPELARLGVLDGKLEVRSRPEEISLNGRIVLIGSEDTGDLSLELAATLPPDFSRVQLDESAVTYQQARLQGKGSVQWSPSVAFDLALVTSDADLQGLLQMPLRLGYSLPATPPPATGKLTSQLHLTGTPEDWEVTGEASFLGLSVQLEGFPDPVRVETLDLKFEPPHLGVAASNLTLQPGLNLSVAGRVDNYRGEDPRVSGRITAGEWPVESLLALAARFGFQPLGEDRKVSGFVQPALEVSGPLADPTRMSYAGTLKFRQLSIKLPELPRPLSVPSLEVELDERRLTAAAFTLSLEPGVNLTVAGTVENYRENPRLQARVTGQEVPVAPLVALAAAFGKNPLGEGQKLSGRVQPDIELSGPLEELGYQGSLGFRDLSLSTPQLPEPVRIPALQLALTPRRVSAEPFTIQIGQRLSARLSFRLDNYQTQPLLVARVEIPEADLAALLGLARTLGTDPLPNGQASGRATATLNLRGPLGAPLELSGHARLVGASVQPAALTEPLAIERADLEFAPDRLELTNLRLAAAGSTLQGSLRVSHFDSPQVNFDLEGDQFDTDRWQALVRAPAARGRGTEFFFPVVYAQEKERDWFARLSGRGRLRFDRVLHGTLTLAPVSSPVVISNQVITCDPIQFGLYEGGGRGRLVIDLRGKEPVVDFNGLLRNVDANQLLSANTESKNRLHGRLGGKLQVRFVGSERPQIAQSATGEGELSLVKGRLSKVNLSQSLVTIARLTGLTFRSRDTPIEDMSTQFTIADGWVRTDNLTLRTPDLTMEAAGGFSLEDELAFDGIATFSPQASRRVASPGTALGGLGRLVYVKDEQGRVIVPFKVRGTFSDMKFSPDPARALRLRRGERGGPGNILDRLLRRKPPQ